MVRLLPDLLSHSAAQFPHHCACSLGEERLRYDELETAASKLAQVLMSSGVASGERVAIYLPKSLMSMVAIFAILKAGAAYVPIATQQPAERTAFLLNDCQIRYLITTPLLYVNTPILAQWPWVCTLENWQADACIHRHPVLAKDLPGVQSPVCRETDITYILYTSGSTGVPKGVVHNHASAMPFVRWAVDTFQLTEQDRLVSHAPLHFDLSVFDIFAAIAVGAEVVLVTEAQANNPKYLAQMMSQKKITIWQSVPSALITMVVYGGFSQFAYPALRYILFAGDIFPIQYLKEIHRAAPHAVLANIYGATETNDTFMYTTTSITDEFQEPLPIGKPLPNIEAVVLNEQNQPIGPGEMGELYVSGPTMMLGYWNETSKPYWREIYPGRFFYKTNDVVKIALNGDYIFLSRIGDIVKSRGFRINLKEVEACLVANPQIREAVVLSKPDEIAGAVLEAFVVPADQSGLTIIELKAYCNKHLPQYMVPHIFHMRTQLPKTSTGKPDKKKVREGSSG